MSCVISENTELTWFRADPLGLHLIRPDTLSTCGRKNSCLSRSFGLALETARQEGSSCSHWSETSSSQNRMNRKIHTCNFSASCPVPLPCPACQQHALPLRRESAQYLEGGYKYTSPFSLRSKKRMQMGENCSSEARALAWRIMRSECRQECVEEWSWQGFTSQNYSKPIPSLIKPFFFYFPFVCVCVCAKELFGDVSVWTWNKLPSLREQILADRILLLQWVLGVLGCFSWLPLPWLFQSTWHFPAM